MIKIKKRAIIATLIGVFLFLTPVSIAMAYTAEEGMVNIGDKSLYAKVIGNDNEQVSVVFASGYADGIYTEVGVSSEPMNETWKPIQQEIAKYAKTIVYDRAGIGKSDKGVNRPSLSQEEINKAVSGGALSYDPTIFETGTGKTALDKARDLHALLEESNIAGPYLLVVHSIAMFDAVEFAKEYPNEVAGIISVDGTFSTAIEDVVSWSRKYNPMIESMFLNQFTEADGTLSEVIQSELQVRNASNALRNIPFTILHPADSGMGEEYQDLTDAAMRDWATWSDNSKLIMVPDSSHYVMLDQPQYVIDAIKEQLKQLNVTVVE